MIESVSTTTCVLRRFHFGWSRFLRAPCSLLVASAICLAATQNSYAGKPAPPPPIGDPTPTPTPPPNNDGESDWKNTGGTDWNTGTNWTAVTGSAPPVAGDVAWFKTAFASGQPNLSASTSIAGLYFGDKAGGIASSGYDITSSSTSVKLTLTGTATTTGGTETSNGSTPAIGADNTSGTNTIDAPIVLGAAAAATQTFFQAGGGTLVVNGSISSTNAIAGLSLNQGGSGTATFTLSGANSYAGTTALSSNVLLNINSATAVSGGALVFSGNATIDNTRGSAITLTNNNAINLSGGSLTFTGTNDLSFGTGTVTMSGGSRSITVTNAGATLTVGSVAEDASSRTLTKAGAGTLVVGGSSSYSGVTNINGGILSVSSLANTGTNSTINIGNTTTAGTLKFTGGNETSSKVINLAGTTGGATIDQSGTGALKFSSNLTATGVGNKTLTLQGSATGTGEIAGAIVDSAGKVTSLVKAGTGTWTLSGTNTYSGLTDISAGTLVLDYTTNNTSKLSDTAGLGLDGSTLQLSGGSHTEVVASTTASMGGSTVSRPSGTSTLRMNAISRGFGATLNFGSANIADTDTTNTNGILGGWATVGGTGASDWAINSTNAADGAITAFSGYTGFVTSGSVATTNYLLSGSATVTASENINSLKIDTTGAGQSLDLTGKILRVTTTGGLMFVGANDYEIKGGTLRTLTSGDLVLQDWGAGTLTISSVISNAESSGAGSFTKAGTGTTVLNSASTYTGTTFINGGTLALDNNNTTTARLAGTTGIVVNSGGTLLLTQSGGTASIDRININAGMTLNGGTFNTGGLSEHGTVANNQAGIGALTLQSSSIIDMGNGNSIIAFANSSAQSWTGTLSIYNWSGTQSGGGTDQLYFGTTSGGLTATQLGEINIYSDNGTTLLGIATILTDGEIVPVPEPATWFAGSLAVIGIGGVWLQRARRRRAIATA